MINTFNLKVFAVVNTSVVKVFVIDNTIGLAACHFTDDTLRGGYCKTIEGLRDQSAIHTEIPDPLGRGSLDSASVHRFEVSRVFYVN